MGIALVAALQLVAHGAGATDCDPASRVSTCFDADELWYSATGSRFVGIAGSELGAPGTLATGAALTYLSRPVLLVAASPDPEGREIAVVEHALNATWAWAYTASRQLELTLATPVTLHQSGSGAEGLTAQSAPPLGRTAVHDPRVGVGLALPVPAAAARSSGLHAKARAELALPLGDEDLYAGEQSFVLAPSLSASIRAGAIFAAAELGARLRRRVPFASAVIGHQLTSFVGLGVDVLGDDRLSVALEAWVLPVLADQPGRAGATSQTSDGMLIPAEWLGSLRSAPFADPGLVLTLGGGTAIPLSSEQRVEGGQPSTDHFAGVTSPAFRLLFAVQYRPGAAE